MIVVVKDCIEVVLTVVVCENVLVRSIVRVNLVSVVVTEIVAGTTTQEHSSEISMSATQIKSGCQRGMGRASCEMDFCGNQFWAETILNLPFTIRLNRHWHISFESLFQATTRGYLWTLFLAENRRPSYVTRNTKRYVPNPPFLSRANLPECCIQKPRRRD